MNQLAILTVASFALAACQTIETPQQQAERIRFENPKPICNQVYNRHIFGCGVAPLTDIRY